VFFVIFEGNDHFDTKDLMETDDHSETMDLEILAIYSLLLEYIYKVCSVWKKGQKNFGES